MECTVEQEYTQLIPSFKQAKLGSFLLVPLKYDPETLNTTWLSANSKKLPFTTMDIGESIKQTINGKNTVNVISRYQIPVELLLKEITSNNTVCELYACEKDTPEDICLNRIFKLHSIQIYIFNTQVAFLSVGIQFNDIKVPECICNPGYVDSRAIYYYKTAAGDYHEFSFDDALTALCARAGLTCFFRSGSNMFLETHTYMTAVVPERFKYLQTIRQAAFNLHLMTSLDTPAEDDSEEDVSFVYAVKDQSLGTYRWGCCISSQTISYVVADATLDIDAEMCAQSEDGVPVVLLALYQKYTCLRFRELLSIADKKQIKRLKQLRRQMLEFRAYGTIAPANISHWHNVKRIYKHIIDENGITEAIEDISHSLNILSEHQKEIESARSSAVMGIITAFGVVSILASVLSIIQILSGGDPTAWLAAIISVFAMLAAIISVLVYHRRS